MLLWWWWIDDVDDVSWYVVTRAEWSVIRHLAPMIPCRVRPRWRWSVRVAVVRLIRHAAMSRPALQTLTVMTCVIERKSDSLKYAVDHSSIRFYLLPNISQFWYSAVYVVEIDGVGNTVHHLNSSGRLPVHWDQLRAQCSLTSMGSLYLYLMVIRRCSGNLTRCKSVWIQVFTWFKFTWCHQNGYVDGKCAPTKSSSYSLGWQLTG